MKHGKSPPSFETLAVHGRLALHAQVLYGRNDHHRAEAAFKSLARALRQAGHPSLADSTLEEMMNRLESVPLLYQPGSGWHYSFAADVVARLVEVGSGQPVDQFLWSPHLELAAVFRRG